MATPAFAIICSPRYQLVSAAASLRMRTAVRTHRIQPAKLPHDRLNEPLHVLLLRHVPVHRHDSVVSPMLLPELISGVLEPLLGPRQVEQPQVELPVLRESQGDAPPDALRCPGDDGDALRV